MDLPIESNSLNKTIHLTGIGLAVQAFYINLTLDSVLGHEYLQLSPVGPVSINPTSVWKINGVPVTRDGKVGRGRTSDRADSKERPNIDTRFLEGAFLANSRHSNRDDASNGKRNDAFKNARGRNKFHQTIGVNTNYRKDENADKITRLFDDDDAGENEQEANFRDVSLIGDGFGNSEERGITNNKQRENTAKEPVLTQPIVPRRRF